MDPSFVQRVAQGIRYVISGVGPDSFFGPGQPLPPAAQEKADNRAFDYPVAYNQRARPRSGEAISFEHLRALGDNYDLMRLVIETRKDQIEAYEWEIVPKDEKADADSLRDSIRAASELMEKPNREHDWPQWLRQVTEELLVIDTVCVYQRPNRGGGTYGFELVDGATIKRLLDDTGRTPLPPSPAYQQILKGLPAVDYTSDDLVYTMRNPRVSRVYGFSPVEQVITTVNIALRRQMSQLENYTAGNIPDAITQVPEGWTVEQIKQFQLWWDSVMEGNTAERRKMRFIPGVKGIDYPKKDALKDEYDEWLARIVCFAFSISPSALIKQVNRASGEQMADTAKEEGLLPLQRFIAGFITGLLARAGYGALKFRWKAVNKTDPVAQAKVNEIYVGIKALTPDEVREDLGKDKLTPQQRAEAFPAPVMPAFDADGEPIPPKEGTAKPAAKPAAEPDPKEPTASEKMLGEAIQALAKSSSRVIELRPEVNVEIGETTVHIPTAKAEHEAKMEKRQQDNNEVLAASMKDVAEVLKGGVEMLSQAFANMRGVLGTLPAPVVNVEPAQITVEAPTVNVAAPNVTVQPPVVNIAPAEVLVKVDVPPAAVEVHQQVEGPTEEVIHRDDKGDIVRVVKRPIK